jgi:hypothetical protein
MHRPEFIEDETVALSESDLEEFAARNDSDLDADIVSSPLDGRRQRASSEKSPVSWPLPLWGVMETRSGMAVARIGVLFCLVIDVIVLSAPQLRFFHVRLAATHWALYATAIAWAMDRRRLLAERALATTDVPAGGANRRGFYQRIVLSSPRQAAEINTS